MNHKWLMIFLFVLLMPDQVSAGTVQSGSLWVVFDQNDQPVFPMSSVDDNKHLKLEEHNVDLSEVNSEEVSDHIKEVLKDSYEIERVVSYSEDKLAKITILGEVDKPGNYLQPQPSSVSMLNDFNSLYDSSVFKASITLIRDGNQQIVNEEMLKKLPVKDGDIYMLSLSKKINPVEEVKQKIISKARAPVQTEKKKDKTVEQILAQSQESNQAEPNKESKDVKPKVSLGTKIKPLAAYESKKDKQTVLEATPNETDELKKEEAYSSVVNILKSYVIQPGDILTINLPGEDGFNDDFLIDRNGTISLPEIGQIKVSGVSLNEAEKLIYKSLSDVFLGLDKLAVLIKERRLLVTVLGFVEVPGEVEMSSAGNVQTAINAAGGLQDGAQLNKLQLQRDGKIIEFNYKEYLDSGDPELIPELLSLDTIFVPSSPELGNVHGDVGSALSAGMDPTEDRSAIRVFGEVIRPGSFPLVDDMSLVDALLRAGGVTRYANVEQIRMIAEGEPVLFDLKRYLDVGDKGQLPTLKEGATIFVPKQVEAVKSGGRVVYVMGQVQKPGAFETGAEVGFLDVLANAGGPNRYADNSMVRILRADGDVVRFNLQSYAEGSNVSLPKVLPGDAIFIPQKSTQVDDSWLRVPTSSSVQMIGAVKKPGRYQWAKGINFMDMLSHAGGPTEKADIAHVRIVSTGQHGEAISREFNLQHFLERGGNWNTLPSLKGGVTVVFPELPEDPSDNKSQWIRLSSEQAIYIMGSVVTPGRYAFSDQMDILDILSAAQGPKDEADLTNIRIIHRNGPAPRVSRLNLVEYFETGDETLLPDVSTGDSIFIPSRNRSWVQKKKDETIRVLGSVKTSGRYEFTSDMTILDVLAESGGPTKTAYIEKIIIVNSSCCDNQAYTFDLMDFMKDPDVSRLPVIRPGDTVYVPDISNTQWAYFMDALKDTLSIVSFVSLTKALIGGSAF